MLGLVLFLFDYSSFYLIGGNMEVTLKKPKVRISYDEMQAFLLLPKPLPDEDYEVEDVMAAVEAAGVRVNVDREKIDAMVMELYYDKECLIAEGIAAIDGTDGYFDFKFDSKLSKKPKHRPDGTVDYWSIHSIELVEGFQRHSVASRNL